MRFVLAALLFLLAAPVHAYDTSGALADPAQEAQARELFRELRCMVCQNQSIDDSDAPLAKDLRALVRERIAAGDDAGTIKSFLVDRYGDFVLLKPRFGAETMLLWGAPLVVLLAGMGVLLTTRRRSRAAPAGLSEDERRKLDALLKDED